MHTRSLIFPLTHASSDCATTAYVFTHIPRAVYLSLYNNDRLCAIRAVIVISWCFINSARCLCALCRSAGEFSRTHPMWALCDDMCAMGDACGDAQPRERSSVCQTRGVCFFCAPCSVKYGRVTRRCRFALFVHELGSAHGRKMWRGKLRREEAWFWAMTPWEHDKRKMWLNLEK